MTLLDEVLAVQESMRLPRKPPPLIVSTWVYERMVDTAEKRVEAETIARGLGFDGIEVV
jgi:hypothetical protein